MFFRLSSLELGLVVFAIVLGTTLVGVVLGRRLRAHADALREPVGVLQAALLGLVALILAFGLTLAVGRYDARRAAVVATANAIGTTYLRAQTLREPMRTRSLDELVRYTDATIRLSRAVPGSDAARAAIADGEALQRSLWRSSGEALVGSPVDSAPRLYVETLNEMIDMQTVQVSALNNRVPTAVLAIEIVGAAVALGLLALYLAILTRGVISVVLAAALVSVLLLITFDLDRPVRGLVTVPDTPLVDLRASMELPPAAEGPGEPGAPRARRSRRDASSRRPPARARGLVGGRASATSRTRARARSPRGRSCGVDGPCERVCQGPEAGRHLVEDLRVRRDDRASRRKIARSASTGRTSRTTRRELGGDGAPDRRSPPATRGPGTDAAPPNGRSRRGRACARPGSARRRCDARHLHVRRSR